MTSATTTRRPYLLPAPDAHLGRPWQRFELRKYRGEGPQIVSADAVHAHLATLARWGITPTAVAQAVGIAAETVRRHARGERFTLPKHYAAAILAVGYMPHPGQTRVLAVGCRRRVQGLAALGWPLTTQASRLGMHDHQVLLRMVNKPTMRAHYRGPIVDLYAELWEQAGPSDRARTWARKHGWATPWAWDDDTIDDPDSDPASYARSATVRGIAAEDIAFLLSPAGGLMTVEAVAAHFNIDEESVSRAAGRHSRRTAPTSVRKLTDDQVSDIRRRRNDDRARVIDLAAEYGVSNSTISTICTGTRRTPLALIHQPEERTG